MSASGHVAGSRSALAEEVCREAHTVAEMASSASTGSTGRDAPSRGGSPVWDAMPKKQGLYDPKLESDACGVGAICDFKSRASRDIVEDGKDMLIRMTHRGATTRPMDGDGAGILCSIPDRYYHCSTMFEGGCRTAWGVRSAFEVVVFVPLQRHFCEALQMPLNFEVLSDFERRAAW